MVLQDLPEVTTTGSWTLKSANEKLSQKTTEQFCQLLGCIGVHILLQKVSTSQ